MRTVKANICGEHQGQDTASCAWCRIAKLREENQRLVGTHAEVRQVYDAIIKEAWEAECERRCTQAKIEVLRELEESFAGWLRCAGLSCEYRKACGDMAVAINKKRKQLEGE